MELPTRSESGLNLEELPSRSGPAAGSGRNLEELPSRSGAVAESAARPPKIVADQGR